MFNFMQYQFEGYYLFLLECSISCSSSLKANTFFFQNVQFHVVLVSRLLSFSSRMFNFMQFQFEGYYLFLLQCSISCSSSLKATICFFQNVQFHVVLVWRVLSFSSRMFNFMQFQFGEYYLFLLECSISCSTSLKATIFFFKNVQFHVVPVWRVLSFSSRMFNFMQYQFEGYYLFLLECFISCSTSLESTILFFQNVQFHVVLVWRVLSFSSRMFYFMQYQFEGY